MLSWYLLKVVIFIVPAPRTNINRLQFLFDQLLNVVDLNSERNAIVVQEGGESAQIFISDFDINRLEKLAWLRPEINLRNDTLNFENEFFACGIRPEFWDLEAELWGLQLGIHPLESGIPLTIAIRNLTSSDKVSRIHGQYLKSVIHSLDPESKFFFDYQLHGARPGRLLNFLTLRVGAYSRWALIRGWALIKFSPFSAISVVFLFCNKNSKCQ